jgi:hypothetical protein
MKIEYLPEPEVIREVDATNSVLEEISKSKRTGSRTLPVELKDKAIPWVAKDIYRRIQFSDQTLEDFIANFTKEVMTGNERVRTHWKYFSGSAGGDVGVILLPSDQSEYFDIVLDEKNERIVKYRYLKLNS